MKRLLVLILSISLIVLPIGMTGCYSSQDPVRYTHTQNDGHLHRYIHQLHPDRYICELCGKVYEGDPSNLREF